MVAADRENEAKERFSKRYGEHRGDVVRQIELAVIGGDWGANGYTTVAQADRLAGLLDLRPGSLVLDIGAGRGWPGLYLAAATGCSVVLTDVPIEGLAHARSRSVGDGLADRTWQVNASARDLPFRVGTFDAVVHTDVLC
jgi:SAM-dependent methyltransferase